MDTPWTPDVKCALHKGVGKGDKQGLNYSPEHWTASCALTQGESSGRSRPLFLSCIETVSLCFVLSPCMKTHGLSIKLLPGFNSLVNSKPLVSSKLVFPNFVLKQAHVYVAETRGRKPANSSPLTFLQNIHL